MGPSADREAACNRPSHWLHFFIHFHFGGCAVKALPPSRRKAETGVLETVYRIGGLCIGELPTCGTLRKCLAKR